MYTLISLFYVALIGMLGMVVLKRHEAKTGKATIVSRLGRGTDHVFHAIFDSVGRVISYINRHTFIALTQWAAFHILIRVRKVYVELKHMTLSNPHGKKVIDAVRGRGEVKDHGASFYLRRISAAEK
jgi:hypothetical protein